MQVNFNTSNTKFGSLSTKIHLAAIKTISENPEVAMNMAKNMKNINDLTKDFVIFTNKKGDKIFPRMRAKGLFSPFVRKSLGREPMKNSDIGSPKFLEEILERVKIFKRG